MSGSHDSFSEQRPEIPMERFGSSSKPPIENFQDPLAEACKRAHLDEAAEAALTAWLAHQLESDTFARLDQSGYTDERRIALARVFVDLEIGPPWTLKSESPEIRGLFIKTLCAEQDVADGVAQPRLSPRRVEGHLLFGGPGQGKSTLGQVLCQLHRALLLVPRIDRLKSEKQRDAVMAFNPKGAGTHLGNPAHLLIPLCFSLADVARFLAAGDKKRVSGAPDASSGLALLNYLANRSQEWGHEASLEADSLLALLRACDSLLVFDGLDEVPASRDRSAVLEAIRGLLGHIPSARRCTIVATTRPQGYAGEFEQMGIEMKTHHLLPLSDQCAMDYARRLVEARCSLDRRAIVLERLQKAMKGYTTSHLMRTPLQVTILSTLVEHIGHAPSDRWTLFKEYYRVVYEREMERSIETAELLREYRPYVDRIHAQVGLLLQVEVERGSEEHLSMPEKDFERVVDGILLEDEIEGVRRKELRERIQRAIRERLVLLVEPRQDRIGFEVRSFQEFMAAWALWSSNEGVMGKRLFRIARSSDYWNVMLFLSSRIFAEHSDLRDFIVDKLCPGLNEGPDEELLGIVRPGSVLALSILEDGAVLMQEKYVKRLFRLALMLLGRAPIEDSERLIKIYLDDLDAMLVMLPMLEEARRRCREAEDPREWARVQLALVDMLEIGLAWVPSMSAADRGSRREKIESEFEGSPAVNRLLSMSKIPNPVRGLSSGDDVLEGIERQRRLLAEAAEPAHQAQIANWLLQLFVDFNELGSRDDDGKRLPAVSLGWSLKDFISVWEAATDRFEFLAPMLSIGYDWFGTSPEWWAWLDQTFSSPPLELMEYIYLLNPSFVQGLSSALNAEPHAKGLLELLASLSRSNETSVDSSLLRSLTESSDPWVARRAWVLLCNQGELAQDEVGHTVELVSKDLDSDIAPVSYIFTRAIVLRFFTPSLLRSITLAFWRCLPFNFAMDAFIQGRMRDLLKVPASLDDPESWSELQLPNPPPSIPNTVPNADPTPFPLAPFRIESIQINNIRAIDELRIQPEPPDNGHGQWFVLIGKNGTGKTTFLRALALTLCDLKSQPDRLPPSTFDAPFRKSKHAPAETCVTVNNKIYKSLIDADKLRDPAKETLDQIPAKLPNGGKSFVPVFAYGCRRGSALGGAKREVLDEPGREIYTLFDEGADLIHAETWLLLRERAALKDPNGPAAALYQHILGVLRSLLPGVEAIESRGSNMVARLEHVGELSLSSLSDGYLTMMGWALDLIARWVKREELRGESLGENFHERMTGIVLIDEIDLHLHPAWQGRVLRDIRKAFPRMTFVVTTHNPLTLLGARPKEIWTFSRAVDGRISAEQGRDTPMFMTGSEIYQAYFEIQHLYPDQIGQQFMRWQILASSPVRDDQEEEELQHLQNVLREHQIDPGWAPVEREAIPPYPGESV